MGVTEVCGVDFGFSEAQEELGALTRRILAGRDAGAIAGEPDDRPLWMELSRAGVLAAGLPAAAGGDGLGLLEQCSVLVELGRAAARVPYLESIVVGASAVARFGTDEQVKRWAAPAGRGEVILTAALGEEPVIAERDGDRWVLTGSRTAVAAAPTAELILVPASLPATNETATDETATGGTATGGAAVFLVDPAGPGVTVEAQEVAGSPGCGRLDLRRATVADEDVLGPVAAGAEVAGWLREHASVGVCAAQLGVCERALELTAGYARTREQFGRPIGAFQAVAGRLADAHIDLEALRLTLWQAAWRVHAGLAAQSEVATAAFWAADAGHRIAHTAVHVHGGVGIDLAHPVHRYFLAATYHEFHLGGATTQLRTLGRALAARTG